MITKIDEEKLRSALVEQWDAVNWYLVLAELDEGGVGLADSMYVYRMDSFDEMFSGVEPVEMVETVNKAHHYGDPGSKFDTGAQYFHENDHGNLESLNGDELADFLTSEEDFIIDAIAELVNDGKVREGSEVEDLLYDLKLVEEN